MKQIYTSYYAVIHKLPEEMNPVGISVGKNRYLKQEIPYDLRLAPTWPMMRMSQEDYDMRMRARLEKLDAQQIYDELPENAVLLCYEKFNDRCHRRMVAEWLEDELGIVVPEYGLKREESFPYVETGPHVKGVKNSPDLQLWNPFEEKEEEQKVENEEPEAVRLRKESYRKDGQNMSIFDFL